MEVEDVVPNDGYGPLNVYNPNRGARYNPGAPFSMYRTNGTLRDGPGSDADHAEDQRLTEEADRIDAQQEEDRAAWAAEAQGQVVAPTQLRSRRLAGTVPGFQSDNDCVNKTDPIFLRKIMAGFKLEADGRCYDLTTLLRIVPSDNGDGSGRVRRSPFTRAPFTPADNARILAASRGGKKGMSKKPRKTAKRKNFRKSKKGGKSKKGRRRLIR